MKNRFLIYGLLLILASWLFAWIAYSETTIYGTFHSSGAGYESGVGIKGEYLYRQSWYGFRAYGELSSQKKNKADEGYTYSVGGQGRLYFYKDFYLAGGYGFARYSSEFANGITWKKSAWWPHAELGLDADRLDVWVTYYPREHQTVNEVETIKLGTSLLFTDHLKAFAELSHMKFDHRDNRESDNLFTVGIGWQF